MMSDRMDKTHKRRAQDAPGKTIKQGDKDPRTLLDALRPPTNVLLSHSSNGCARALRPVFRFTTIRGSCAAASTYRNGGPGFVGLLEGGRKPERRENRGQRRGGAGGARDTDRRRPSFQPLYS